MYTLALKRDFIAQHFLIGGDWGAENELHSHHYQVELQLQGDRLDPHGYLVDLLDVEQALDALLAGYRDRVLNELAGFEGLNPSLERFSRLLCEALSARLAAANLRTIRVRLWESQAAWASFQIDR